MFGPEAPGSALLIGTGAAAAAVGWFAPILAQVSPAPEWAMQGGALVVLGFVIYRTYLVEMPANRRLMADEREASREEAKLERAAWAEQLQRQRDRERERDEAFTTVLSNLVAASDHHTALLVHHDMTVRGKNDGAIGPSLADIQERDK